MNYLKNPDIFNFLFFRKKKNELKWVKSPSRLARKGDQNKI